MTEITQLREKIEKNISKVIVGKLNTIELLLVALLCDGHVLIEDVPGVGKTMLARSLAISLGGQFKRLQCTPDLLPNDITGVSISIRLNRTLNLGPAPYLSTSCWWMKSTGPPPARRPPCWKLCKNARLPWTA